MSEDYEPVGELSGGRSIKKQWKYLVGKYKVSNFALALRERRFPGGLRGRGELKIVKFVSNVLID